MKQLIIVGAGPAGVSAALYAIRLGVTPLVIHNGIGALKKASIIENYYGLPTPISGEKLYETGLSQLKALNIPVAEEELLSIAYDNGNFFCFSSILASDFRCFLCTYQYTAGLSPVFCTFFLLF
jgi:thioredoxin reductase